MNKKLSILSTTICLSLIFLSNVFVLPVFAQVQLIGGDTADGIKSQLSSAGEFSTTASSSIAQDPRLIAAYVIKVALSFLTTILVVLIFLAGYWYFTARGDDEKVTKAKDTIRRAIMGLILILLAFAITQYIVNTISTSLEQGSDAFENQVQ
jgi:uncharacterized membrane protein YwzB